MKGIVSAQQSQLLGSLALVGREQVPSTYEENGPDQLDTADVLSLAARRPWRVYPDSERGGFIVKYYAKDGRRKQHRVPAEFVTPEDANRHAELWYDEHIGRPPETPLRTRSNQLPDDITLEQFGLLWTSGKLAELYPDHVKMKASAAQDEGRLRLYVNAVIGRLQVKGIRGAARFAANRARLATSTEREPQRRIAPSRAASPPPIDDTRLLPGEADYNQSASAGFLA